MATLQAIVPSYLYQQYSDDDALQAFVQAYNQYQQSYLDTFNSLNLPIYTMLSGALLDWVGAGVYGYPRPTLPASAAVSIGPYATEIFAQKNTMYAYQNTTPGTVYTTSDDIYQRLLTWHFYKGDGKIFSIKWLKKRVMRFLIGANGTAPLLDYTYPVSIVQSGYSMTITVPIYPAAAYLAVAVASGAAELPPQYSYSFVIKIGRAHV